MICSSKLNDFINAQSLDELWRLHTRTMREYGFDRLLYGFTRYRTESSLGDPEDFVVMTNHNTTYVDFFINQRFYMHAPMMRHVFRRDGAISWSVLKKDIETQCLTDKEQQVLEFNQAQNITAGYTISFKSMSTRSKGAIALTAQEGMSQEEVDELWISHGEDITFLNNLTHLRLLSLPYHIPGRELTSRQREVLAWVGDGKTTQDIAMLLSLTPATVEKHLRLAREVLRVETTAQAVLKASFLNQIFVLDR